MQGSRKKFIIDIIYSFIPVSVNKLSSLLYLPLIFQYAGVAAYGIWQQFGLSAQVLLHIGSMNVGIGIKKYLSQETDRQKIGQQFYSALLWVLFFSMGCSLVLLAANQPLGKLLFTDDENGLLIVLLALYIPLEAMLNEVANVLRAIREVKVLAVMGPLRVLTKLATVATGLMVTGASIQQVIAYFIFAEFVVLLIFLAILWHKEGLRAFGIDLRSSWKYVRYGFPFVIAGISTWSSAFSDRFFVLHFHGIEAVGIYSGAYVLASIPLLFANPICQILLPDLSALLGLGQKDRAIKRAENVMLIYGLLSGMLSLLVVVIGPLALEWLGKAPLSNPHLMMILALALGGYGLLTLQSNVLTAFLGRARFNVVWVGIAICNIGLNLALIPRLGMIGAASASVATYLLGSLALGWLLRDKIGSRYLIWVFGLLGFAVSVAAILPKGVTIVDEFGKALIATILGVVVYVGVGFMLFRQRLLTITGKEEA